VKSLRAGVIGLGVGEAHIRSYQEIEGVEVAAICDIDQQRCKEIGHRYGIRGQHVDYRAVTENRDIDVVSVCSYDDCHAKQLISAFRHGKHVMVEKPVVLHRREAEDVFRAFKESGCKITSNLILRQSPRFREVKRLIDEGAFGDIFYVEGDYLHHILWKITEGWRGRMDFYCTFYGGGIHLVDLMRWLVGDEFASVSAMSNDILIRGSSYKYPDFFAALLQFRSGAIAKCATTLGPQRTKFHALNVYGSKLTFANDMPHGKLFSGDRLEDERAVITPYPGMEKGDLLPDFIDAIRKNRAPTVNEIDIFRVMDTCFAVWESSQNGQRVNIQYLI
jgi:UDP-N-acetyl-2-amino-2-deoxyglucuronate dehydrogenase